MVWTGLRDMMASVFARTNRGSIFLRGAASV